MAILEGWRVTNEVVVNSFLVGSMNMRQKERMSQQFGAGTKAKDDAEARQHEEP